MPDCMTFPDTVEEFMEQYKVVDTEQIYTNGIELVPIYRMRQWFQHDLEIVRCEDCKHYVKDHGWNGIEYTVCNISPLHKVLRKPNDFCSKAERRLG